MKNAIRIIPLVFLVALPLAAQTGATTERQIAAAVSPLPEELRESARVMGWNEDGSLRELRPGSGGLTCLADKEGDERFHAACYHNDLEPFMARGRALTAEGLERDAVRAKRQEEIESGALAMPDGARSLYSLTGKLEHFDHETATLTQGNRIFVVYIPYATEASTGLPPKPMVPAAPWIMDPGLPWAHIMVVQQVGEPAPE